MRKLLVSSVAVVAVVAVTLVLKTHQATEAAGSKGPMIGHMVYFSLKDNSAQAKEKLVAACKKHLAKHPGQVFFAAGTLADDLKRPVNDRDFDVALHLVFEDRKAHNQYQDAPRHKQFIEE
jgi:hypothetical protein